MRNNSQNIAVENQANTNDYAGNVILHLSDLHFGYNENKQAVSERKKALDQLIDTVASTEDVSWRPTIVCITGDIAMRADSCEYQEAKIWIEKLKTALNIESKNIVVCPGNHDVIRTEAQGHAPPLDSEIADRLLSIDHYEKHLSPFAEYNNFCNSLTIPPYSIARKNSFVTGCRYVNGIRFICLNSAWFSQRNKNGDKYDDRNKLWLGLKLLSLLETENEFPLIKSTGSRCVTIVLFHHPFEWLHFDEINERPPRQNTKEFIALRSHVILTGHDHSIPSRPDQPSSCAHHFKSGATYVNPIYDNSFHLIKLNETTHEDDGFKFRPSSSNTRWERISESPNALLYWDHIAEFMYNSRKQELQKQKDQIKAQLGSEFNIFEQTMLGSDYKKSEENFKSGCVLLAEAKQLLNKEELQEIIYKYGRIIQNHLPLMDTDIQGRFTERMKGILELC